MKGVKSTLPLLTLQAPLLFGFLLACLLAEMCAPAASGNSEDAVLARGLQHTSQDRETVARAIELTNLFLTETNIRLLPSWLTTGNNEPLGGAVPVYLVSARDGAKAIPAAVPKGCRCIFVNPKLLSDWVVNNSTGSGRMSIDRSTTVRTFM
jgi:hypothetical protein